MLRSLYAGVSGMTSNQTKMDVIGNNIANSSTTAFKSGRVRFEDMFSQTMANAQAPNEEGLGGVNPQQVGLGVRVGAIDTVFTNGALQPTGRDLDFAIEGEGFFIVSDDSAAQMRSYTRDGAFFRDYDGNLVNAGGQRILGYKPVNPTQDADDIPTGNQLAPLGIQKDIPVVDEDGDPVLDGDGNQVKITLESFFIDGSGLISAVYSDGEVYYLGRVATARFDNPEGLEKQGGNNYAASANSGAPQIGNPGEGGSGIIRQGNLEMSNVDLANEFTEMIITSRSYQANSRIITTSDEMLQELINLKR